jgi:hypothetical protein
VTAPDALAIEQLLREHITPGATTLGELGALLRCSTWLRDEDVALVTEVAGKLPVPWSDGDTAAVLTVPGGALYLAVAGELSAVEIASALRGEAQDLRVSGAIVRAAATG